MVTHSATEDYERAERGRRIHEFPRVCYYCLMADFMRYMDRLNGNWLRSVPASEVPCDVPACRGRWALWIQGKVPMN